MIFTARQLKREWVVTALLKTCNFMQASTKARPLQRSKELKNSSARTMPKIARVAPLLNRYRE